MDIDWVALAFSDISWIFLAFMLGFVARAVSLPPLVGFLITGFALNYFDIASGETLQKLADLGITLLLFTVGLKLDLKVLLRPQVWAVTGLHIGFTIILYSTLLMLLAKTGLSLFTDFNFSIAILLAFALSFSSTVFVVKSLEDKGEMLSLHGSIAVGILVMQDLVAVSFMAISTGKLPSDWSLLLLLLLPLRPLLHFFLMRTGHGELLILYGLVLALGGAELFELVGVKGDLGALIMGVLIAGNPKSAEMFKAMLGFKDLFLVSFFLSIGMSGSLSADAFVLGAVLAVLVLIKSGLFFALMTRFRLRARTSLLATISLSNYSEFGLIVAALAVSAGWLSVDWLVVIAVALSLSFVIAAPLSRIDNQLYHRYRSFWMGFQTQKRLHDDKLIDVQGATIAIFGMGRVGSGAYEKMRELHGDTVIGIDFDSSKVKRLQMNGRNVLQGDPSDSDFWEKMDRNHSIETVLLTLPNLQGNIEALKQLKATSFRGRVAATARFPDDVRALRHAGVDAVFNIYTEAGAGFAEHVENKFNGTSQAEELT